MASSGIDPFLKGNTGRNTRGLLRIVILCTIAAAAVASRLFSVIRMYQQPNVNNPRWLRWLICLYRIREYYSRMYALQHDQSMGA
jgi:hypothetical protein